MNKSAAFKLNKTVVYALITFLAVMLTFKFPLIGLVAVPLSCIPAFVSLLSLGVGYFALYVILTCAMSFPVFKLGALSLFPFVFMPAVFLAAGSKLGMKPLNAICVALLSSTVFSTGITMTMTSSFDSKELESQKAKIFQQTEIFEKQFDGLLEKDPNSYKSVENAKLIMSKAVETFLMLVPATMFFIMHLATVFVVYISASKMSEKLGFSLDPLPAFKDWQFDWNIVWFYMFGMLFYYVLANYQQQLGTNLAGMLKTIGANFMAMSSLIYYIAGLSLLFFMFNKYQVGMFTRVTLSFFALVFTQIIIWVGIVDVWANFRKPKSVHCSSGSDDSDSGLFY